MRRILWAVLPLLMSGFFMSAWAGTCGNGYTFSRQIKLQKAVGSDQTNFPVPIVGTYAPLKTVANGGQVQNTANNSISVSGPADLVFCDAASSGNALKYEVVSYDGTTGAFEMWVQIPTLHTATNDSIYLFANNSGVSTSQQDLSLWGDAGYKAVYHCSSLTSDSAGNFNLTNTGAASNSSSTIIGDSCYFNGSATMVASTSTGLASTAVTVEMWMNPVSNGANNSNYYILDGNFNAGGWVLRNFSAQMDWVGNYTGGLYVDRSSSNLYTTGQWQYIAETVTGTTRLMYKNGSSQSFTTPGGTPGSLGSTIIPLRIGADQTGAANFINAYLDEIRVATAAKTTNWLATAYSYQAGKVSAYQIVESSYSIPTIAQLVSCEYPGGGASGSAVCATPFNLTSGGDLAVTIATINTACGSITSAAGNSCSLQQQGDFTGSLQHYYTCMYTCPITSTGAETITGFSSQNSSMMVHEIKAVTVSGIAGDQDSNNAPAGTLTATSPGANSFLICSTRDTDPSAVTSVSAGLTLFKGMVAPENSGHPSLDVIGYGVVGSGSQSCTFSGGGNSGAMIIMANSPTATTSKRRPSQVY